MVNWIVWRIFWLICIIYKYCALKNAGFIDQNIKAVAEVENFKNECVEFVCNNNLKLLSFLH